MFMVVVRGRGKGIGESVRGVFRSRHPVEVEGRVSIGDGSGKVSGRVAHLIWQRSRRSSLQLLLVLSLLCRIDLDLGGSQSRCGDELQLRVTIRINSKTGTTSEISIIFTNGI